MFFIPFCESIVGIMKIIIARNPFIKFIIGVFCVAINISEPQPSVLHRDRKATDMRYRALKQIYISKKIKKKTGRCTPLELNNIDVY